MMTDQERARIVAEGLSEAQRDALFGRFSWRDPIEQECGEAELYRLGLWGPHGGRSDLAIAVRAYLQASPTRENE